MQNLSALIDPNNALTVGAPILIAIITGLVTFLVAKGRTKIDVTSVIASGFENLTNQLQEERTDLIKIIEKHRVDLAMLESKTIAHDSTIRRMRRHIERLEQMMANAGLPVPDNPFQDDGIS